MEKSEKLWIRNFVLIIVINFLVFMNHIMLLSTFPFYIESLGGAPLTQLPAIWGGTVLKNFPMALLWNLFAAGPLTRLIFRGVCRRNIQLKSAEDSI